MKKTLAAATAAALVGVIGAANAADLYHGGSMKDAPAFVPPPVWTGFYIGAHVGGAWADVKANDGGALDYYFDTGKGTPYSWNNNADGVFGGGTVGYNYQTGAFVFGVEADFGAAGLTGSWNDAGLGFAAGHAGYFSVENKDTFYADVTGRLGYAAGPALFYVKGGWAYIDSPISINAYYTGLDGLPHSWSGSPNGLDGWTIGGGIEYMWSPSWSVKAEYLYFDFGSNTVSWTNPLDSKTWTYSNDLTVNTFKVGLNYHFGNGYAPLK